MRIGLDARLNAYRRGGIAEYTRQLLTAMAPLADGDEFLVLQHRNHECPLVVAPNVRRITTLTPPHHRLEQVALPVELLPLRLDILHCPDFVAPRRRPCPAVVTIHDLAFLRYAEILDDNARRYYSQVGASARRANAIIAVSEATRQDVSALLDLPPERIDLVYEAAAPVFQPLALAENEQRELNQHRLVAGSFALFVSTLEPRKNLPTLLKALRACRDRQPATPYRLVIAGERGWRYDEIFATVRDLRLADDLVFLGGVTQQDLVWLYNACRLYINPSLYEGFGLPVLEALACGAPTLIAATSSLPEVAGDAALQTPPTDVEAWADVIERLWHDEEQRCDLARRGPLQAAQFSWQRAARETLAIYRRVATPS
jgi:glycosyltransferase involved in cell wall biosynthesis